MVFNADTVGQNDFFFIKNRSEKSSQNYMQIGAKMFMQQEKSPENPQNRPKNSQTNGTSLEG